MTYAASAPGHDARGPLLVRRRHGRARRCRACKGVGERHALGRRRPRDPRLARPGQAARARRHGGERERAAARRPTSTSPAAAARSAGRSRRSARSPARARSRTSRRCRSALPGGRKVRLDDLGDVTDGAAEPRTFARLDGQPVVAFGVSPRQGRERRHGRRAGRGEDRAAPDAASRRSSSPRSTPRSTTRSATTIRPWRP